MELKFFRAYFFGISTLFASAQASWGPAENVTEPGSHTECVGVVSDLTGNAFVLIKNKPLTPLQASSHPRNGSWQIFPENLSAPFVDADDADIAVDAKGNTVAVWTKVIMGLHQVKAAEKPLRGSWSAPVTLSFSGGNCRNPRIVMTPSGEATVTWMQALIDKKDNFFAERISGVWSTPLPIPGATSVESAPNLVMDDKGNVAAIWIQKEGLDSRVAASIKWGGLWQAAPDFLSDAGLQVSSPSIVLGSLGNAIGIWKHATGIQAASKPKQRAWGAPVSLSSQEGEVEEAPVILMDKRGNATALWTINSSVESAYKPYEAAWKPSELIAAYGDHVRGAIDFDGNVTVAWVARDDFSVPHIKTKIKSADGSWPLKAESVTVAQEPLNHLVVVGFVDTQTLVWDNGSLANVQSSSYSYSPPDILLPSEPPVVVTPTPPVEPPVIVRPEPPSKPAQIGTPSKVQGIQKKIRFTTQTDMVNVLTWEAPVSGPTPVVYCIYRNASLTSLVSKVSAREDLLVHDHNRIKGKSYTYYIVAVDARGNASQPAIIRIEPSTQPR